jgi:arsenical pump membrane protein
MFVRPRFVPMWCGCVLMALIGLISTAIPGHVVSASFHLLARPLLFLVFSVPLAVLLDRLGVFAALAGLVDHNDRLIDWLWVLAAAVTIVFNLDASVVLLTPLYIRIARRHGYAPEALAFQPALLACLASNPLPVSNLTNLIASERLRLHVGEFVAHLLLPTVVACAVGLVLYRRVLPIVRYHPDWATEEIDPRALRRGLPIIAFVLVGFTLGSALGIPEWVVAAIGVLWSAALTLHVPWRAVPLEAVLVAAALSVLVAGAASTLNFTRVFDGIGVAGRVRALSFGVVASDLSNNLPAMLAATPALHQRSQVWALLVGTNLGPVLVVTGALSGLLWRDTARRLGVPVSARRYSEIGVKVGLPALLAAALVVLA